MEFRQWLFLKLFSGPFETHVKSELFIMERKLQKAFNDRIDILEAAANKHRERTERLQDKAMEMHEKPSELEIQIKRIADLLEKKIVCLTE